MKEMIKSLMDKDLFLLFLRYCAEQKDADKQYEGRNILTLIIYKCEHKEELTKFETIILIYFACLYAKVGTEFIMRLGGKHGKTI